MGGGGLGKAQALGGQERQPLNSEHPRAWPVAIPSHPHICELGAVLPWVEKVFDKAQVKSREAAGTSEQPPPWEGQARGGQGPSRWWRWDQDSACPGGGVVAPPVAEEGALAASPASGRQKAWLLRTGRVRQRRTPGGAPSPPPTLPHPLGPSSKCSNFRSAQAREVIGPSVPKGKALSAFFTRGSPTSYTLHLRLWSAGTA